MENEIPGAGATADQAELLRLRNELAETKLRDSEARYRVLFESIDEGFCTVQMIFDREGRAVDYRFLETNPAFARQTGLIDAVGKTVLSLAPDHETFWFDIYGKIAATGIAERFEHRADALGRWYDVYAFQIGEPKEAKVAILFHDIKARKLAEEALRASEARLAAALESVPVGLAVLDDKGKAIVMNEEYRRFLPSGVIPSRDPDALAHWRAWNAAGDRLDPDDFPGARALRGERVVPGQEMIYTDDLGQERWTSVATVPVNDPSGSVIGVATVISDITARKQADEAVRKSEEHMRALITASSDVVYRLNPDWQEMRHLHGRGFLIDANRPTVRWMDDYIFPEDQAEIRAAIDKAIESRSPFELEHRVRRTDGTEGWTSSKAIPVFGDDGEIIEWFGMAADVTDRVMAHNAAQAANEAQQRSEERHRLIVESALDYAIFTTDREGKVEEWPPGAQAVFGWRPEEIVGRDLAITYTPEDRAAGVPATELRKALEEGFAENVRWHMRKDGSRVFIEGFARPLPDRDAAGRGVVKIGQDVTARRQWEETQKVLVAELQHRTRNLIAVVRSIAAQTMRETGPTPEFMERFSYRMSALSRVQGLLSRSEIEPITIRTLVDMELSALGSVAKRVSIDGPEVFLKNSTVQTFALAIHELATNARKYGALATDDGILTISWSTYASLDEETRLILEWVEEASVPRRLETFAAGSGYGRELIEKALPYSLAARTSYDLTETHLRCTIDLPIKQRETG